MLTKRQNLLETMNGGNPDRFVNEFDPFALIPSNPLMLEPRAIRGAGPKVDAWGVTRIWPEDVLAQFPVHDEEHIVVKDIEHWQDYVKAPSLKFSEAEWEPLIAKAEAVDRNEQFVMTQVVPGIFEQVHYLCEIKNALIYFYESPDELAELIKYITEWELQLAELTCDHLKPEGVFHHDDWGTQISTFMSPEMFEEFFLDSYKQIYGYYKSRGASLIMHHSDSYAATLVPYMIDMGINIWQGVMTSNDLPTLIKQYGPQITFMGGIDSATVDFPGWTPEIIEEEVRRACTEYGKLYYIPCPTQGGPMSTFEGVYECVAEKIDLVSKELFV